VGGCDLSAVRDLTAATLLIKKPNDPNFYVLQQCFLPQARVDAVEQSNAREAPYRLWAEQGWLTICEGATIDFHAVTEWFKQMVEVHDIRPLYLGYDRALSGYWAEDMISEGFDIEKIAQGPRTWTYPFKQLIGLFQEHKVVYQNSPLLRWASLNVGIKSLNTDGIQSITPVKSSDSKRIDPFVSLLNAYTCYLNHENEFNNYVR
jgi:phage terminase large subunit-like protein